MSTVLAVLVIVVLLCIVVGIYQKITNNVCDSIRKLNGKTAVVTGGTAGMGLEIATDFARRGAKVIIACPFEEEGVNARKQIVATTGNEKVIYQHLDLSSIKSVRDFANEIIQNESRLDLLINNAGVGVPDDIITADGLSFIMQVNYFGHFLLTLLLLPLLKKSGSLSDPSRIINTSSVLHNLGKGDTKARNRRNLFAKILVYANSKFCLVLFARELTKKLESRNVVVNSVDPGAVGTRIFESAGVVHGYIIPLLFRNMFKTTWEGAQTAIYAAVDEEAGKYSGEFFKNCQLSKAISAAYNPNYAERVWEKSKQCVRISDEEVEKCLKS